MLGKAKLILKRKNESFTAAHSCHLSYIGGQGRSTPRWNTVWMQREVKVSCSNLARPNTKNWGYSSVVDASSSMYETLGKSLAPSTHRDRERKEKRERRQGGRSEEEKREGKQKERKGGGEEEGGRKRGKRKEKKRRKI